MSLRPERLSPRAGPRCGAAVAAAVRSTVVVCALALLAQAPAAAAPACRASSSERTAAVVELYTSEGCSSCPPADRQLGQLASLVGADAVTVPLAFHVNFWDGLGWRDPYAQLGFSERQRRLVHANGSRTVYTPHFFVGGVEAPGWPDALRDGVRRVNGRASTAALSVEASEARRGTLLIDATAKPITPAPAAAAAGPKAAGGPVLYLAVTEDGLRSRVTRGENGGSTLGHDHVVRAWLGPFAVGRDGSARIRQEVPLAPGWQLGRMNAVAVLQDGPEGAVLQAVRTGACLGG